MHQIVENAILIAVITGQYIFVAVAITALLRLIPIRTYRWKHLAIFSWHTNQMPDRWLSMLRLSRESASFVKRELLLRGCGVTSDAAWYAALRRIAIVFIILLLAVLTAVYRSMNDLGPIMSLIVILTATLFILFMDTAWLQSIRKARSLRLTKEIFVVSRQLLYLSDSSLHLHAKLGRCVPYTSAMRGMLEQLLAEWYHDAGGALQRFKQRIGTEEGFSFVETLDALRLHDSKQYYELLRLRIGDFKEKIELDKESRKESTSYILFVIAGIPILYTFQVFIYPWVKEGQKLFQSLN